MYVRSKAEKIMGFMLSARGIEANPDKCRVVLDMQSARSLKEVQHLISRLTALSRFIPRLAERIRPIVKTMKKNSPLKWVDECERAFVKVKTILSSPLVMRRPDEGHDL